MSPAMTERPWNIVDADRAIAWREYSFSKGAYATTLVLSLIHI